MTRITHLGVVFLFFAAAAIAAENSAWTTDHRWGGIGGIFLLPDTGELWVEVEKADLNRSDKPTFMTLILFGPDRQVLDEKTIPDDGQAKGSGTGPVQHARVATTVRGVGIYGVLVTVSNDRYGENVEWGFRTNCTHYVIETARGHRDADHEEPIVLRNPDVAGDVCFVPRAGEFTIDVAEASSESGPLELFNALDEKVGELPIGSDGTGSAKFRADTVSAMEPWRLHLPKYSGSVQIDGVTRWSQKDSFRDETLWSPQKDSWFGFAAVRWMLTPYSNTIYAGTQEDGTSTFQVHNNDSRSTAVTLDIEFPEDKKWSAELDKSEVTLGPNQSTEVTLRYQLPAEGDQWECKVRAIPNDAPELATFSTFRLRRGIAPALAPLSMPLDLKPFQHENEQLGYAPSCPLTNQVYFDMNNRPVVNNGDGLSVLNDGKWPTASYTAPGSAPIRSATTKVAFDRDNGIYSIGDANGKVLLYSGDGGNHFAATAIPAPGTCDIEQFSGHNLPDGPPPFVQFNLTEKDPNLIWRRLNDMLLYLPKKEADGTVSLQEPVLITKKCIGYSGHSGMPSTIVSRGSKVHVVWAEATDPAEQVPGVPTYAATYDRETGTLGAPALIGYGPPANDVHNTPCITMDSEGYLHVLIGTHGATFKYSRSLKPNSTADGWTPAEDLGAGLRQTYVGMVCDKDDTLHVVFRLWQDDTQRFPSGIYACLAYMSKRKGEAWSAPRLLVVPPFSEYSVYYHRLTIDRKGRLFLSYDYWSTLWFYRNDHMGSRRALMMSPDSGATWKLVDSSDFAQ
ncbi:MAG: BNR repeat-containing protein [Candidatus Hydrogenedentes bacterium]|nr:BNR repeat-containing protein [Candidatus Hydrogenedentota bacterium]